MIKQFNTIAMVAIAAIVLVSCTNEAPKEAGAISGTPAQKHVQVPAPAGTSTPKKGDQVPNNLVCMVNDAYMANSNWKFRSRVSYITVVARCVKSVFQMMPRSEWRSILTL